jgi:hypothetical protein
MAFPMPMPYSATPLAFLLLPFLEKDVVRNGIPGVMDADEEQQQHRRPDSKQGLM